MSEPQTLFELMQKAKWSHNLEEQKSAIRELSKYGEEAITQLQEILSVTAYDDIKAACTDAIKSAQSRGEKESSANTPDITPKTEANATTASKDQKKEERQSASRAAKPE